MQRKTSKPFEQLANKISHSQIFILSLVMVFIAPYYFYKAAVLKYPTGWAGLYMTMAEIINQNAFRLPDVIPYYGPGGIPFAYPPLGAYVMVLIPKVFNLPDLDYVRFAPPLFAMISLVPIYFLSLDITGSKKKALLSLLFFAFSANFYIRCICAGGIIRGLAFLLSSAGVYAAFQAIQKGKPRMLIISGCLLAGTILTHFTSAVFYIITIFAFIFYNKASLKKVFTAGVILFLGLVLSSGWWIHIIKLHGLNVFVNVISSHGNEEIIHGLTGIWGIVKVISYYINVFIYMPVLGVLVFVGMLYLIKQRRYFLPFWFFLLLFFTSESERHIIVVGCMIGSILLWDFLTILPKINIGVYKAAQFFTVLVIVVVNALPSIRVVSKIQPTFSASIFDLSEWFVSNSPPSATYLYLSGDGGDMEWLPSFIKRTPLVGFWGAEWKGTYYSEYSRVNETITCYHNLSVSCINQLFDQYNLDPDYLIIDLRQSNGVENQMSLLPDTWIFVYNNETYGVYANSVHNDVVMPSWPKPAPAAASK